MRQPLLAFKQPLGFVLCVVSVNPGCLIPEVQHEPQFDARVGASDLDVLRLRRFDGIVEFVVLISVEHTPVLIGNATTTVLLIAQVLLSLLDGFLDESQRSAVEFIDGDKSSIPMLPKPVLDVVGFSASSLGEYVEAAVGNRSRRRLAGSPSLRFPSLSQGVAVVTSSAASANPPSMRIGRAP